MGKTRSKKRFSGPTARPTPNGLVCDAIEELELEEGGEGPWQQIIQKLQSGSSEERECGCVSLSTMVGTREAADDIVEKRIIRIVAPLLMDSNLSVRHAAIGALKNISLVDPEICDEMVQQDVMTPLCWLLTKICGEDWQPSQDKSKKKGGKTASAAAAAIDSKAEIFVECVDLLWNLCEANDTALKIFHEENVLDLLMKHANVDIFGHRIVAPILQCVYSASEDCSGDMLTKLAAHEHMFSSLRLRPASDSADLYLQLLAHGITLHITQAKGEPVEPILPEIMTSVAIVLDQDQRKLIHDYSSLVPMINGNNSDTNDGEAMEEDSNGKFEAVRDSINSMILAQQTALELLTNCCCEDGQDWEEMASETESNESDEIEDDILDRPEAAVMYENESGSPRMMPIVLLEAIISRGILAKVLAKATLPAENVQEILKSAQGIRCDGPMVLQMAKTLQARAFLCLNNLIEAMTIEDLGGCESLFGLWTNLGALCLSKEAQSDQITEAATSAMRAVTQRLSAAKSTQMEALAQTDVEKMLEFGANHNISSVRINVVHIAGSIGHLVINQLNSGASASEGTKQIAKFLIEAAARDVDLRVVAEALDKIFDMFAEDYTDPLCVEVALVSRLKQLQPGLKVKMNMAKQKRGDQETLALADMARLNLLRFIKYKEKTARSKANGSASTNGTPHR